MQPDILVRNANGDEVLAVEVKARRGVDSEWAQHLRRNLTAHGGYISPRFFMVITTDKAFLWRDLSDTDRLEVRAPDVTAPTRELLGDHLPAETNLDGRALELVVSAWLNSVAGSDIPPMATPPVEAFLVGSGLHDALHRSGSSIAFEVA